MSEEKAWPLDELELEELELLELEEPELEELELDEPDEPPPPQDASTAIPTTRHQILITLTTLNISFFLLCNSKSNKRVDKISGGIF